MLKKCAGSGVLRFVELAGELRARPSRQSTRFVAQLELDAELPRQGGDVGQAATRESQVAIKIFEASDDARRAGD